MDGMDSGFRIERGRLAAAACAVLALFLGGCTGANPDRRGTNPRPSNTSLLNEIPTRGTRNDAVARAEMLRRQGYLDQALAEFERAIATNPKLTVAYMGAGDIYRERGDYNMAERRFGSAAQIEPSNFGAQYQHGLMLQLLDRVAEAIRAYLRAAALRPEDFNTNLNLATAYLQLNEPSQGVPFAERAVRIDPRSAPARVNLGATYTAMGRNEDAIVEYQQAAELTELSVPLLLNLADAYGRAARYEEMSNTLDRLVRTEPTAIAHERLGSAHFRLRRYSESLASYRKAAEIDPNHYPALNGIAVNLLNTWLLSNQSNDSAYREAISALKRSLQIERNQPGALELLSRYQ
jgi:tetratricopeptide (TPR) repeat protein